MPYKRKRPRGRSARRWRDELDEYWKGTIWQRIAIDRQMWKQHAEAFVSLHDTLDEIKVSLLNVINAVTVYPLSFVCKTCAAAYFVKIFTTVLFCHNCVIMEICTF